MRALRYTESGHHVSTEDAQHADPFVSHLHERLNVLNQRRRGRVVAAAVVVGVLLAGCTSGPDGGDDPVGEYTAPAWMAQVAQRNEEVGQAMVSCLAEGGIVMEVDADGGLSRTIKEPTSRAESDAQSKQWEDVAGPCSEQIEERYGPEPQLSDDEAYDRMSQTVECVRANGYPDIGEPPTRDVWLETYYNQPETWSAYQQLWTLHQDTMTSGEWSRLKSVCVESGVVWGVSFANKKD